MDKLLSWPVCDKDRGTKEIKLIKVSKIQKEKVVDAIVRTEKAEYEELKEIVGEEDACNAVFALWYPLSVELLTYQKYKQKEAK